MQRGLGLILLAIALAVTGCRENKADVAEVRPVRTMVINPAPIDDDRYAVGEIRPRYESDLGFRVSGKVISRLVDVGMSVKAGDVLARLDDQDYTNKLKAAEADIVAIQAVITDAKATEGRQRQLLSSGTTTKANYDTALRNLRSAEAKLDAAKANRDSAKDQLAYAELHAEFDGIVTATAAEPGQVVAIGQTVIRLARPGDRDAVFAAPEAAFKGRADDAAMPEVTVALLSDPNIKVDGVVREISPIADPTTRTYQVKVTLPSPPEQMRFGASVSGRLKAQTAAVVVLPSTALTDKEGKPAVWLFDAAAKAVELHPVTVSRYETDRVIIGDGLKKGDIVVTAGVHRLRPGQKVSLIEGAPKAEGAAK